MTTERKEKKFYFVRKLLRDGKYHVFVRIEVPAILDVQDLGEEFAFDDHDDALEAAADLEQIERLREY